MPQRDCDSDNLAALNGEWAKHLLYLVKNVEFTRKKTKKKTKSYNTIILSWKITTTKKKHSILSSYICLNSFDMEIINKKKKIN